MERQARRILLLMTAAATLPQLNTALDSVTLTSTLNSDDTVYPSMKITFTCTTRGTNIQEWYSEAYISGVDDRIQLHQGRHTGSGRAANATIISTGMENGTIVIVSELCIITSSQYLMPTVSCGNNGFGMRKNISFVIQVVILNSTLEHLRDELVVYPQQTVYFTCKTIGSNIQEWYSVEYISGVDDRIQLHEGRRSGRGRAANATIISVTTNKLGEKVITSRLSLIASTQYPVATVSCGNNGQGTRETITFRIQTLNLTTTLENVHDRYLAYPLQRVYFTCTTIGANIQEWYSSEYIRGVDDRIQLHEGRHSGRGRVANATIVSVTTNGAGEKIIISQLTLVASTQYSVATVSCGNNGHGVKDNITFNVTDPPAPRINSSLHPEGTACPGERVNFSCVTLDSTNQTWTSDNYTGGEHIHIGHMLLAGQPKNSTLFPSTSAELISKSEVNGRLQLVSLLTITVSESATGQIHSVTCFCNDEDSRSISFQVAAVCDITKFGNLTTTRETIRVASSEEEKSIGMYIGVTICVAVLLVTIITSIALIMVYAMKRQKDKGKGRINRAPHKGNSDDTEERHRGSSSPPPDEKKKWLTETKNSPTSLGTASSTDDSIANSPQGSTRMAEDVSSDGAECISVVTGSGRDGLPTNIRDI